MLLNSFLLLGGITPIWARASLEIENKSLFPLKTGAGDTPYSTLAAHTIGKMGLTVINRGQFGTGFFEGDVRDPVTGVIAPSCVYPYPGQTHYLFTGAFWLGAVVGRDTLVSLGADGWLFVEEMWPDPYPKGDIERHSISDPDDTLAISEQDFIAIYTDTVTRPQYVGADPLDNRTHVPLNMEITQRSYAWSYDYADDFVLFDYSIKNIGRRTLNRVYMGFYVDGDAGSIDKVWDEAQDDICGFRRTVPSPLGCGYTDTINIAWIADNNGINESSNEECPGTNKSPKSTTGMMVIRTPSDSLKYSFNWWISNGNSALDFGPRQIGNPDDPFRDFGGFLGTPMGDRNKYYIMRHEEFDYDQLFTGRDNTADGWLPRPPQALDFADGYDTRYLLSFGPFDIYPGEILPISFAYVGGENFFSDCEAFEDFDQAFPELYYATFNFQELGQNAIWASWIYDNPGVDTDGNGDSGDVRLCVYDSVYVESLGVYIPTDFDRFFYRGDGVPDFRGAAPPPPPELWMIDPYPSGDTVRAMTYPVINEFNHGEVTVQWYGYRSENTIDYFSNQKDFEGYRVYLSLTNQPKDYVILASYDREDFNKYIYIANRNTWDLFDPPFTSDSLKILYGDSFNPYDHNRDNPLFWLDSSFYFLPQDWNQASVTDTFQIHKVYPDQPYPSTLNHDTAAVYYPDELTEYGYFKYYMYQFKVRNLLPSRKYYFSVTAFDYGSPTSKLASLETPVNQNFIAEFPQNQNSVVNAEGLKVVVYPNPYRGDVDYLGVGFEGLDNPQLSEERQHRIHFTNIPNKCIIRIFTIDGDLVRQIDHDCPMDWPRCNHAEWDLITRNTQAAVSGIYYYSVESASGTQIGKFVIIM